MIPSTGGRVPGHTADRVNEVICRQTREEIARIASQGAEAIDSRVEELDRERDLERTLEANAGTVALLGLGLGTFVHRRFYLGPAAVAGLLLQHAVQGWCSQIPSCGRPGVRAASEIDEVRGPLKSLRGDFRAIGDGGAPDPDRIERALPAVRL